MSTPADGSSVAHVREDQARRLEDEAKRTVNETIEKCARALERDTAAYHRYVAVKCRDVLAPALLDKRDRQPEFYAERLAGSDGWHGTALTDFLTDPDEYVQAVRRGPGEFEQLSAAVGGGPTTARAAVATVRRSYRSLVAIAEYEGIRDGAGVTKAPAYEYCHQVGQRRYSKHSRADASEQLIDPSDDLKATLLTGGQGAGKTTALATLVEDRVARGHKIVDLVDFFKAENSTYDIPQQQASLRGVREQMGLATTFADATDYDPPSVQIVAPLTDGLADAEVPYDPDVEAFEVQPFVIPASSLSYRQLVMLIPHTTPAMENYLQSAYQHLNGTNRDWTLPDIATTVREETNAGEAIANRIENALERTQQKPYLRDHKSDHVLDWDGLMADRSTATAFTVFMLRETSDQKAVVSYLLDRLYSERKRLIREHRLSEFPPLTAVFRELHKVVPKQKSEQDDEKTLEGYMIDTFSDLIALMRHVNMDIIADTQKFDQQLSPVVAGLFHRVFAFSGQKPDINEVFRTRVGDSSPAARVAEYDEGVCALIDDDGYRMPIQMAPPRCHHVDAEEGVDGFSARVRYGSAEWETPPWDASIPPRLQFRDVPDGPAAVFCREGLIRTRSHEDWITKERMTEAFHAWAKANERDTLPHNRFHGLVKNYFEFDGSGSRKVLDGDQTMIRRGLKLTDEVEQLLQEAQADAE